MNLKAFLSKALSLETGWIRSVEEEDGRCLVVRLAPPAKSIRCGGCGRRSRWRHGSAEKTRQWRELGWFGFRIRLVCEVFRVICRDCNVRTMGVPWARTGSWFTRAFEDEVAWFLQMTNQTAVALYFGLDWATVGRIARRVVAEKLSRENLLDGLRFIGIDEISYGRPRKFLTVVVDLERRRVVWVGEGQSSATLGQFFELLGEDRRSRIEVASIDMDAAFEKAIREWLPETKIVFDRFHVVQLLSGAVDEIRRTECARVSHQPERSTALKRTRWALLKNPWNLTRRERAKLKDLERTNRRLYRAYLLKEAFQEIYDAPTAAEAESRFREWYGWARRSRLAPIARFAATVRTRWEGIRQFFECRITNGPTEGWNAKIRMISHRAFGFHSPTNLIAMILLCCSGVRITPIGHR